MAAEGDAAQPAVRVTPRISRIRPIEALRALVGLGRDPQDVRQVFRAEVALRGRSGLKLFRRFVATPLGPVVLAERRRLMLVLDDHAALARLPEGSLGRAYLAFMQEENLSAEGLMLASQVDDLGCGPEGRLVQDRVRDMHDLTHVVTGYGRDPLGELCLLAFMYRQTGNRGSIVIVIAAVLGFLKASGARKGVGADLVQQGAVGKAGTAILEGFRNGRRGPWLPGLEWEALLGENLEALRRRLHVPEPATYRAVGAGV